MKLAVKWLEYVASLIVFLIVAGLLAAVIAHSISNPPKRHADLILPPQDLICPHDSEGHCFIRGR